MSPYSGQVGQSIQVYGHCIDNISIIFIPSSPKMDDSFAVFKTFSCRICLQYSTDERPVVSLPCDCIGEAGKVHARCFLRWAEHKRRIGDPVLGCEICLTGLTVAEVEENQRQPLVVKDLMVQVWRSHQDKKFQLLLNLSLVLAQIVMAAFLSRFWQMSIGAQTQSQFEKYLQVIVISLVFIAVLLLIVNIPCLCGFCFYLILVLASKIAFSGPWDPFLSSLAAYCLILLLGTNTIHLCAYFGKRLREAYVVVTDYRVVRRIRIRNQGNGRETR